MRRLRDLLESLDETRMNGPFFQVSGFFLVAAAAAFMLIIFGLFMDKAVARPAFFLVAGCLLVMVVDAVRSTIQSRDRG